MKEKKKSFLPLYTVTIFHPNYLYHAYLDCILSAYKLYLFSLLFLPVDFLVTPLYKEKKLANVSFHNRKIQKRKKWKNKNKNEKRRIKNNKRKYKIGIKNKRRLAISISFNPPLLKRRGGGQLNKSRAPIFF